MRGQRGKERHLLLGSCTTGRELDLFALLLDRVLRLRDELRDADDGLLLAAKAASRFKPAHSPSLHSDSDSDSKSSSYSDSLSSSSLAQLDLDSTPNPSLASVALQRVLPLLSHSSTWALVQQTSPISALPRNSSAAMASSKSKGGPSLSSTVSSKSKKAFRIPTAVGVPMKCFDTSVAPPLGVAILKLGGSPAIASHAKARPNAGGRFLDDC
mmetsp:Transcript_94667/g.149758  ORF Transcript_94667/g.149758 Transcript_94667/m.149758 type:complete len:213 (+) Transcript_94667:227-865(+)